MDGYEHSRETEAEGAQHATKDQQPKVAFASNATAHARRLASNDVKGPYYWGRLFSHCDASTVGEALKPTSGVGEVMSKSDRGCGW
jgi:hypothetical protein